MPAVPPAPCSSGDPLNLQFAPGLETWASNIVQPNIVRHALFRHKGRTFEDRPALLHLDDLR